MRATDIIGCDVFDSRGEHVGHVHDLRFESSGRPGTGQWQCRLTGIACGRTAIGHRLGYGTGDMAGPWPISALAHRWKRRRLEIAWSDVASFERPKITLRITKEQARGGRS